MCCFEIFQLTPLMVKCPSELHPVFTVSLHGVGFSHEKVKRAVACVHDFLRHPQFTQRNFSSETEISLLNPAVTAADAVRQSYKFDPRGAIGVEASPVIADLMSCRENIVYEGRQSKIHESVGLVQKLLHHQLLVRLHPARLSASLMSLR